MKFIRENFLYIVIMVWVLLDLSLVRKEFMHIMELPSNLSSTYTEAKLRTDGPVYTFSQNLMRLTPESSSIIFLYRKFTHFRKAAYYTYPRRMVPQKDPSKVDASLLSEGDFLAVYMPGEKGVFNRLDSNPELEKIYVQQGGRNLQNNKERGGVMGLLGLAAAMAVFMVAGLLFIGFIGPRGYDPLFRLALAYPLGIGLVTLQMFFYSLLYIPFGFSVIALPWLLSGFFVFLFWLPDGRLREGKAQRRPGLLERALLSVILFQILFSLLNSAALPVQGYDAWVIWLLKGKAFYLDRAVRHEFFGNALYSNGNPGAYAYPLLVPLSVAFGYTGMGHIDDRLIMILFSMYYASLLIIFYHLLRQKSSRETALLFTAMLATVPRVMMQAALRGAGYADLPLSVYFLAGAGFGYRYIDGGDKRDLLVSTVFLSMGAWTKNEGLTFLLFALGLLSLHALRKERAWAFIPAFMTALLITLPWQIYKTSLPELSVSMVSDLSVSTVFSNIGRLPFILCVIGPKLLMPV